MEKKGIFFAVLAIAYVSGSSEELVEFLNREFSEISGNQIKIFALVKEISWKEGERNLIQATLLLNNTYRGLAFHIFEIENGQNEFSIISHEVPDSFHDPLGVNYIQRALLNTLTASEIALEELNVKKTNVSEAVLYSASVEIEKTQYKVDVLLFNNSRYEYVTSTKVLTVLRTIIKESLKYTGIVIAGILGFLTAFSGLYLYYRKNKNVPFVQMKDVRVYSGEKNV
jgi:hypothetical protein